MTWKEREGGGDLGSSNNGGERALGLLDGAIQVVQLLLQQEARQTLGDHLGHSCTQGTVNAVPTRPPPWQMNSEATCVPPQAIFLDTRDGSQFSNTN